MPVVNPGEVWMIDFGMAAKVRPAKSSRIPGLCGLPASLRDSQQPFRMDRMNRSQISLIEGQQ